MPDSALREFGQKLTDCDWTSLHDANDIDEKCEAFYSTLLPLIDTYFPARRVKTHEKDMPWITPKNQVPWSSNAKLPSPQTNQHAGGSLETRSPDA